MGLRGMAAVWLAPGKSCVLGHQAGGRGANDTRDSEPRRRSDPKNSKQVSLGREPRLAPTCGPAGNPCSPPWANSARQKFEVTYKEAPTRFRNVTERQVKGTRLARPPDSGSESQLYHRRVSPPVSNSTAPPASPPARWRRPLRHLLPWAVSGTSSPAGAGNRRRH